MAELKKCPFCGGEVQYEEFDDGFFAWGRVKCQCGVMLTTPPVTTIEAWNNRTEDGGWIPCSERLPDESLNSVLGWDEYRERCVFVRYLRGKWILGNDESVKVIAWQPLPAPYKIGGK